MDDASIATAEVSMGPCEALNAIIIDSVADQAAVS